MENATKALLIAAGVLVAILIISLGIGIFNTASEQTDNANLTEYEIQSFNEKFTKYEGENKTGAEVNALLDTVFTHNNSQEHSNTKVAVNVTGDGQTEGKSNITTADLAEDKDLKAPAKVSTGYRYKIKCKYSTTTKLITEINVETKQ